MDLRMEEKLQRSNPRYSVISSRCSVDFQSTVWIFMLQHGFSHCNVDFHATTWICS